MVYTKMFTSGGGATCTLDLVLSSAGKLRLESPAQWRNYSGIQKKVVSSKIGIKA